ncbi:MULTISPECIES: hypothetical protein [Enterococcus]|uniref:hypothetical protein n=1 Tax=Enterococcus TaxID=1350 RepID=UPI001A9A1C0F|nr:hypothetical protein [Enterococcus faecalis]MEB6069975.1 hypothetical protein [Enterococcus faecalis]MEB6189189.1 hypothetical protein [Enterococcus faecalis]
MSEQKYFTAHEVLEKVEGVNSLSTLNKWANFIQKECDYLFHVDYLPFESHGRKGRSVNHRKTRLFSAEDIKKLQNVAHLVPQIGRDQALRKVFDVHKKINGISSQELMEAAENLFDAKWVEKEKVIQALLREYKRTSEQFLELSQRLDQLEKQAESSLDTASSGWFRRKR